MKFCCTLEQPGKFSKVLVLWPRPRYNWLTAMNVTANLGIFLFVSLCYLRPGLTMWFRPALIHCVAQDGLEPSVFFLPQPPRRWDDKCAPTCPETLGFLKGFLVVLILSKLEIRSQNVQNSFRMIVENSLYVN